MDWADRDLLWGTREGCCSVEEEESEVKQNERHGCFETGDGAAEKCYPGNKINQLKTATFVL